MPLTLNFFNCFSKSSTDVLALLPATPLLRQGGGTLRQKYTQSLWGILSFSNLFTSYLQPGKSLLANPCMQNVLAMHSNKSSNCKLLLLSSTTLIPSPHPSVGGLSAYPIINTRLSDKTQMSQYWAPQLSSHVPKDDSCTLLLKAALPQGYWRIN